MGDIADLMLSGEICEVCGVELDDDMDAGYPRRCSGCATPEGKRPTNNFFCIHPSCKKCFATTEAAAQHYRDKHSR